MKSLVAALALLFAPTAAFALGGTLERPGIAEPAGTDLSQLRKVLAREDFTYVTGWFINAHSVLCYSGDAEDLSRFLHGLAECKGITVSLRFSKEAGQVRSPFDRKQPDSRACQWRVEHNAWVDAGRVSVLVFLGDDRIDLDKLNLPDWHGGAQRNDEALRVVIPPVEAP